jgi:uncharacterized membrane protein YqiK
LSITGVLPFAVFARRGGCLAASIDLRVAGRTCATRIARAGRFVDGIEDSERRGPPGPVTARRNGRGGRSGRILAGCAHSGSDEPKDREPDTRAGQRVSRPQGREEMPFALLNLLWAVPVLLMLIFYKRTLRIVGIVIIPENGIGIVTKKFRLFGENKTLPDGAILALKGEAGIQADTLPPGLHFWLWPWQYSVDTVDFVTVPQGKIGIVESRDGIPLAGGRVLAKHVNCDSFQDARAFLTKGGERGPQLSVIPPGTYRINSALFDLQQASITEIPDNMIGIVTTKEGRPLATGDIAGDEVPNHNMFQDGQQFINSGGFKGLQVQVLLAGRYFINPKFATVEMKPLTAVPIAHAGVVIAFVGKKGQDVTGDTFKHGNLVKVGERGVWVDPLDPGMYPINIYTHKVEMVPTANIVLNWATGKTESHRLDEKLSTITVRSSDGFKFNLDVSQIIHIPRNDAPRVIARFGSVGNLVTQVLEPTIGNYFRNAAQGSDVIEFLKSRHQKQDDAKSAIKKALEEYNVNAVDTLIGDIVPPDELMKTLTDRKLAEQQQVTFGTQRMAQEENQKLQQATALANTQATVVNAERKVAIADFEAQAAVKKAEGEAKAKIATASGDAKSKTVNAEADANVLLTVGKAKGENVTAIGTAEAEVIQKKTNAVGPANFALIEVLRALAENKVPLVPQIVAGGGGADGTQSMLNLVLANLLKPELVPLDKPVASSGETETKPAG